MQKYFQSTDQQTKKITELSYHDTRDAVWQIRPTFENALDGSLLFI